MANQPPDQTPAETGSPQWWDERYRSGDIPWDTGQVPPEVEELLAQRVIAPGWALDLGCGSGVSSRFLCRHGYQVAGIDLAQSALVRARRSAEQEGLAQACLFCLADVAELSFLNLQATLAIDVGCFHALPSGRRAAYISSLAAHLLPGAHYLLYAFEAAPGASDGPAGIGPRDIATFAPALILRWARHGYDRERPSAWYLFRRASSTGNGGQSYLPPGALQVESSA